jgi:hypothetical protein
MIDTNVWRKSRGVHEPTIPASATATLNRVRMTWAVGTVSRRVPNT